jgi:hypothetical protein
MNIRPAALGLLALLAAACGTDAVRIYDVWFDHKVDFAALKTFSVRPIATSVEVSDALARQAEAAIRAHLSQRGYQEVADGADFAVATEIEFVTINNSRSNLRRAGASLRFTILRGAQGIEIWRAIGSAEKANKSTERGERVQRAVDLTLQRFPPKPHDYGR